MDSDNSYSWDTYFGENGHQWALYQRRNGMNGGHRFNGHRGDVMTAEYLATLTNNPCYTACYNGKRAVNAQSVPDINNIAAMQLWSNTIEARYRQYRQTVFTYPSTLANLFRNFNYHNGYVGLEVPDGAHWANSTDQSGCSSGELLAESDQHFTLANYSANKIVATLPSQRFQVYAYDGHASTPGINISPKIDVQVVAMGFQSETSAEGLLNRWYKKASNVSEYQYMNLTQWSGETPSFYLRDLTRTITRLKKQSSQGITWEASPAKFASLPFLLAANKDLINNTPVDSTLREFCNNMFPGAANTVYELLHLWTDEKLVTLSSWVNDNRYKLPLYLQLLSKISSQTENAPPLVKERVLELKAYVHYMAVYYDWAYDQRSDSAKAGKAAALCTYLARINKLQVVNSYFLIMVIMNKYKSSGTMYQQYNVSNGTAYLQGALPLITPAEIEEDYLRDLAKMLIPAAQYKFEEATDVNNKLKEAMLLPLEKISLKLLYTNGKDYPGRSEFFIQAPSAGSFEIKYTPHFEMAGKGYVNFTVENVNGNLQVLKDYSIHQTDQGGTFSVVLPTAGTYKLSVVTKYKSSVDLVMKANGNYFYKNTAFLGTGVENYRANLLNFPGYFYIPKGISRLFFSINNSNSGGKGFASPAEIGKSFLFRDHNGTAVTPQLVSGSDSALFFIDMPAGADKKFWQVFKMEGYRLCFSNISNQLWFGTRPACKPADFTTTVTNQAGKCTTSFKTTAPAKGLQWLLYDNGTSLKIENRQSVDLPGSFSPNSIVTLTLADDCSTTKRLGDEPNYLSQLTSCASGAPLPARQDSSVTSVPIVYPNPGPGLFHVYQQGNSGVAEHIAVLTSTGSIVARFKNVVSFNISHLPAGLYFYLVIVKGKQSHGKLVKR
jgi:hypothetical protein